MPERKKNRLENYNYSQNGAYFITICTRDRQKILSAPKVIAGMKRCVSKECGVLIWQKGFYDHIIRNQADYNEIWEYIENNPKKQVLNNQPQAK